MVLMRGLAPVVWVVCGSILVAGCAATDRGGAPGERDRVTDASVAGDSGSHDATRQGTDGQVVTPVPGDGETCERLDIAATPATPHMMILADRSSSMSADTQAPSCPPCYETRWDSSVRALKSVTAQAQDRVDFGLMLFPTVGAAPGPDGVICEAGEISVPVGAQRATAVAGALNGASPGGATPTAAALTSAAQALMAVQMGGDPVASYVLLVNDGEPTCPADTGAEDTYEALDALRSDGIRTYVVGYGIDVNSTAGATMAEMASRGGTDRFFPAEDEAQLLDALDIIVGRVVSCDYALQKAPPRSDEFVRVEIDGATIAPGTDGWSRDGMRVQLDGRACERLRDGQPHNVVITVECEPVEVF